MGKTRKLRNNFRKQGRSRKYGGSKKSSPKRHSPKRHSPKKISPKQALSLKSFVNKYPAFASQIGLNVHAKKFTPKRR